jgi:UDP-glucuronate 4-epimerase
MTVARTLLVTGGAGMVGQHVAEAAKAQGWRVVLADLGWPAAGLWAPHDRRVELDVADEAACLRATEGAAAVVHCAAVVGPQRARADATRTVRVNVAGTAWLLHAAQAHGARLINLSTATLYGHRPALEPLPEDTALDPLTVYDGTKRMTEVYCSAYRRTFGVEAASVRTGFVYGLGTAIGEYFLPRVLRGESIREPAGREHPCDFTYVVDLADGLLAAAAAPELPHDVYNLTGGVLRTRGELAQAVRQLVPHADIEQGAGTDPARHLRGACVIERARTDFGWTPRFTLEQGLADWKRRLDALQT